MKIKSTAKEIAQKIFNEKKSYHKEKAKLPIEEKIKILVELQKIGIEANPKMRNKKSWKI
ncbi:MAG: hypothetical protein L0Y79_07330 [Chlorobi bacterium]|nr:hypothetical protein [Chlorobiota bacterium]MCI0715987.1 hypothetical protein [Chlorobiota bacterium]